MDTLDVTHADITIHAAGTKHSPAMIIGLAAAFKLIVLNIATSMRKCSIAATNEKSVAPAGRTEA